VNGIREAERLRDEAIKRGWQNAAEKFRDLSLQAIIVLSETEDEFTTDDVWEYFGENNVGLTHDGRALGGAMKRAEGLGLIAPTDRFVSSERAACHRRPVRVWVSLVKGSK
jgi:hypothetical protein